MYKVIIKGVDPNIDKDRFLMELSQHGEIETLIVEDNKAIVLVKDKEVAESLYMDYSDRYLRGKPVKADPPEKI